MYSTRHETILNIISTDREVTVQEPSTRLSVSEVTIRKDLTHLEDIGCWIRTRRRPYSRRFQNYPDIRRQTSGEHS